MRSFLCRAVFLCAILVPLVDFGHHAVAQTVPFYADGFGAYTPDTPTTGTFVAPGVGTRLGRYVTVGGVVITPTEDPLVSTFESDEGNNFGFATGASAGDALITSFENGIVTLTPTGNPDEFTAIWEADAVVLGGSGEFANVRPSKKPLKVVAVNAPFKLSDTTWKFKWTLEGKIDLGQEKRLRMNPLKIVGGGFVPALPSPMSTWETSGKATQMGRYTSPPLGSGDENTVQIDDDDLFLDGYPLEGELLIPFGGTSTFIAANNAELAANFEGFIEILFADGTIRWVADFTPVVDECTGKFEKIDSGSIVMLALSPFAPTDIPFTWFGDGDLVFAKGK